MLWTRVPAPPSTPPSSLLPPHAAGIVANLVRQAAKTCPAACLLIISNPVNSLVPLAAEVRARGPPRPTSHPRHRSATKRGEGGGRRSIRSVILGGGAIRCSGGASRALTWPAHGEAFDSGAEHAHRPRAMSGWVSLAGAVEQSGRR
jgi:hypothetical protein